MCKMMASLAVMVCSPGADPPPVIGPAPTADRKSVNDGFPFQSIAEQYLHRAPIREKTHRCVVTPARRAVALSA